MIYHMHASFVHRVKRANSNATLNLTCCSYRIFSSLPTCLKILSPPRNRCIPSVQYAAAVGTRCWPLLPIQTEAHKCVL